MRYRRRPEQRSRWRWSKAPPPREQKPPLLPLLPLLVLLLLLCEKVLAPRPSVPCLLQVLLRLCCCCRKTPRLCLTHIVSIAHVAWAIDYVAAVN